MDAKDLFEFYEKAYYHELSARDSINHRIPIFVPIFIAFISCYAYFFKGIVVDFSNYAFLSFFSICSISIVIFLCFSTCCVKALTGHTYSCLPSTNLIENHHRDTVEYYQKSKKELKQNELENKVAESIQETIKKYYIDCSSANIKVNDKRSLFIRFSLVLATIHTCLIFILFLIFTFGKLDKNLVYNSAQKLTIENSMAIQFEEECNGFKKFYIKEETIMDNDNSESTPPPPQAPPIRYVKEDLDLPWLPGKKDDEQTEGE